MSDTPPTRVRRTFVERWVRRSQGYFKRNGFQLQRFAFFAAFPVAVYWVFSDNDRVEALYQWSKPPTTQPAAVLESIPDDIMKRFQRGEELNDILVSHAKAERERKERQAAQLEELKQQQLKYQELSAKQSVSTARPL